MKIGIEPSRRPRELETGDPPGWRDLLALRSTWPVLAGCALILVCAWLPWETTDADMPSARRVVAGISGYSAVGLQLSLFALFSLLAAAAPWVRQAEARIVHLLPSLLGAVTLLLCMEELGVIGRDLLYNGTVIEPAFWLSLLGSVLIGVGGAATSMLVVRAHPATELPETSHRFDPSSVRPLVSGVGGFAISAAIVVWETRGSAEYAVAAPCLVVAGVLVFGYPLGWLVDLSLHRWLPGVGEARRAKARRSRGPVAPEMDRLRREGPSR